MPCLFKMKRNGGHIQNDSTHREKAIEKCTEDFTVAEAEKAAAFHRTLPSYSPTPLVALKNLAGLLGVSDIYVKDESQRFGLNAFKALGGSYCIQRCMEQKQQNCTFVAATDGNHGRGVAWAASEMRDLSAEGKFHRTFVEHSEARNQGKHYRMEL